MLKLKEHSSTKVYAALVISLFGLSACNNTKDSNESATPQQKVEKLQVVDCLLPGQTRKLGNQIYLTPRRPAMITAADCEIRGGEYVAYDRADYKTALKVWLPTAESGDSEAQANVGEIFERGLGGEPNYELALHWYNKSAEQGNKRALFNLGTLYEQGLGVEKDKVLAMNYYREAWGLPADSIVYQSAVDQQMLEQESKLEKAIARKDRQMRALNRQIALLQEDLKTERNNGLREELQGLNELIAGLREENDGNKQKLAAIAKENQKRKLRTVVTKEQPTFKGNATELVAKDINFGKYYALVIGIADYDNVEKLDTPINDTEEVTNILEKDYGFEVTKLLNADNISVMEAINNLNAQLTENDNLLIFYAGHGVTVNAGELESGYWLPSNADAPPRDTNWVSNEFITRHLARLNAKRVLVVADSCYAGLLSSSPDFLMLGDTQNNAEFLKYKANKRSRLLLTSGGNLPVLDRANGDSKHSIFAKAFIESLKNNQGIMTGPELYRSVHEKVIDESKTAKFEQEPAYKVIKGAGHEVGEFFFVKQG